MHITGKLEVSQFLHLKQCQRSETLITGGLILLLLYLSFLFFQSYLIWQSSTEWFATNIILGVKLVPMGYWNSNRHIVLIPEASKNPPYH